MQTIEFETIVSQNCIHIPIDFPELNNQKAKVLLQFPDLTGKRNYDKNSLIEAVNKAIGSNIFGNIKDSSAWQQELRNEWE